MQYTMTSPQLNTLIRNVGTTSPVVKEAARSFITRGTALVEGNIRQEAPVRTGELRRRIRSNVSNYMGRVYPTIKYAIYVNDGTPAHFIRPKTKKSLFWEGARHPVKLVKHPGTAKNEFFYRGADKSTPGLDRLGEELFDRIERHITMGL